MRSPKSPVFGPEFLSELLGARAAGRLVDGPDRDHPTDRAKGFETVEGGKRGERLEGDDGDDRLLGNAGDDSLYGGDGTDIVRGGAGKDRLRGNDGDDRLEGGDDTDRMFGDDGNDVMTGGEGRDLMLGGRGDDTLMGDGGNDRLKGQTGNDMIDGGTGNDRISGGSGDDILAGGLGTDRIRGGKGDDRIVDDMASGGRIRGDQGADSIVLDGTAGTFGRTRVDGGSGRDTLTVVLDEATIADADFRAELRAYELSGGRKVSFDSLDLDVRRVETITFLTSDGEVVTSNRAPSLAAATLTAVEGGAVATLDLAALTSDPDAGDSFTYAITDQPDIGSASIDGDTLRYTPGPDDPDLFEGQSLTDSVTVVVTDASGATAVQTYQLTIDGAGQAPVPVTIDFESLAAGSYDPPEIDGLTIRTGDDRLIVADASVSYADSVFAMRPDSHVFATDGGTARIEDAGADSFDIVSLEIGATGTDAYDATIVVTTAAGTTNFTASGFGSETVEIEIDDVLSIDVTSTGEVLIDNIVFV